MDHWGRVAILEINYSWHPVKSVPDILLPVEYADTFIERLMYGQENNFALFKDGAGNYYTAHGIAHSSTDWRKALKKASQYGLINNVSEFENDLLGVVAQT